MGDQPLLFPNEQDVEDVDPFTFEDDPQRDRRPGINPEIYAAQKVYVKNRAVSHPDKIAISGTKFYETLKDNWNSMKWLPVNLPLLDASYFPIPRDFFLLTIACAFLNPIFGIIGIVFAFTAKKKYLQGSFREARKASDFALKLAILGVIVTILIVLIVLGARQVR